MKKIALAVGTLAAGTALLLPAAASAQPLDHPLLNSTCTFEQVDKALHVVAPDAAARLDTQPEAKAAIKAVWELPVDQRKARVQQFLAQQPDAGAWRDQNPGKVAEILQKGQQIADTCGNY